MTDTDTDTDTDDAELERLLRGLPLRRPDDRLDGRVRAAVPARRRHPIRRWAAAAAVLLAGSVPAWWIARRPTVSPARRVAPSAGPVSVERVVAETVDDGVVAVRDRVPYRRLRHRAVRQVWWTDPTTGARLWAELPTERVTVEPAETF